MESEKDILQKAIRLALTSADKDFAPDAIIDSVITEVRAHPEVWQNGHLKEHVKEIVDHFLDDPGFREDYELSDENFECVDALIEAEEMLGDQADDETLIDMFDYTPAELKRLRIIAKYLNGVDREKAYKVFAKKYGL